MNWVSWDGLFRLCEVVSIAAGAIAVAALIGQVVAGHVLSGRQSQEIENLKLDVAKQQERAARAEKDLLEIQRRTSFPVFNAEQRERIKQRFQKLLADNKQLDGRIMIVYVDGNSESEKFARQVFRIMEDAGWDLRINGSPMPRQMATFSGLQLVCADFGGMDVAQRVRDIFFHEAGMVPVLEMLSPALMHQRGFIPDVVTLAIGLP